MKRILLIAALALAMCACGGEAKKSAQGAKEEKVYTEKDLKTMSVNEITKMYENHIKDFLKACDAKNLAKALKCAEKLETQTELIGDYVWGDLSEKDSMKIVEKIYSLDEKYESDLMDAFSWLERAKYEADEDEANDAADEWESAWDEAEDEWESAWDEAEDELESAWDEAEDEWESAWDEVEDEYEAAKNMVKDSYKAAAAAASYYGGELEDEWEDAMEAAADAWEDAMDEYGDFDW